MARDNFPSDLILAAAEAGPSIRSVVGGYLGMTELPQCLRIAELRARALYNGGWRPRLATGPSRDELADIVSAALHKTGHGQLTLHVDDMPPRRILGTS